jgi:PKD repeat protein
MNHWLYRLLLLLVSTPALAASPGIVFVQNRGQWPADVQFRADVPGGFLFLKKNSLHYVFYDAKTVADVHTAAVGSAPAMLRAQGVEVQFAGSADAPALDPKKRSATTFNYFLGKDSSHWAGDAPAFAEVIYHDLYPGINLRVYAWYQTLKYEFVIRPGADPDQIKLVYAGADRLRLAEDKLLVETGVTTFAENKPYSFVSRNGTATEVAARWQLTDSTARFVLPNGYDHTLPLTIDPELVFSSFSGAQSDNWGNTATYDDAGFLYAGSTAFGLSFPTTRGAFQVSYGGLVDVAILKFYPDGTALQYATFLGGSGTEVPHSLIVNSQKELVILGSTSSNNFPVTAGCYQPTNRTAPGTANFEPLSGYAFTQSSEIFVAKLSNTGTRLTGSTYLGGSGNDGLNLNQAPTGPDTSSVRLRNYGDEFRGEVITGPDDDIYVASTTSSPDFPTTTNGNVPPGPQTTDGVAVRLSADLTKLRWSARVGGGQSDAATAIRLTSDGNVFVAGTTFSHDLPTDNDAYQPRKKAREDAFIVKLAGPLGQRLRMTYVGTDGPDVGYLLDLGPNGDPHLLGITQSVYPTTTGVYQNKGSGQFIHAFDPDLRQTRFATVIGSGRIGPDISPTAFLVNECGNMYIAGWGGAVNVRTSANGNNLASSTNGLPVTPGAYLTTTNGSTFWLGILEKNAKSLLYGTFFGTTANTRGDHVDGGTCRFSKDGTIYHAACACGSSSFPTTINAVSRTNNSTNCNVAGFKFNIDKLKAAFDIYQGSTKDVVSGCVPLTLNFANTSEGGRRYEWLLDGKLVSRDSTQTSITFSKPGKYVMKLRAYNPLTCTAIDSTERLITVNPANFQISPGVAGCADQPVSLSASGGVSYVWTPATGLSDPRIANPIAKPTASTTYSVLITNEFGCTTTKTVSVTVDGSFRPDFAVKATPSCGRVAALSVTNRTQNADSLVWDMGNGVKIRTNDPGNYAYPQSGRYTITLTSYRNGCALSKSQVVDIENLDKVPNVVTANHDGKNETFDCGYTGAKFEVFNRWGKPLLQTDNYANDWGQNVPVGTYFYVLTTPGGLECKGWIEVLQ